MSRRKLRAANRREGGGVGDRRCCPGCRQFLPPERKDHYCLACRAKRKTAREMRAMASDKRFRGHMALELLGRYFG